MSTLSFSGLAKVQSVTLVYLLSMQNTFYQCSVPHCLSRARSNVYCGMNCLKYGSLHVVHNIKDTQKHEVKISIPYISVCITYIRTVVHSHRCFSLQIVYRTNDYDRDEIEESGRITSS